MRDPIEDAKRMFTQTDWTPHFNVVAEELGKLRDGSNGTNQRVSELEQVVQSQQKLLSSVSDYLKLKTDNGGSASSGRRSRRELPNQSEPDDDRVENVSAE